MRGRSHVPRHSGRRHGRGFAVLVAGLQVAVVAAVLPTGGALAGTAWPSSAPRVSGPSAAAAPSSAAPPSLSDSARPDVTSAALDARLTGHRVEVTGLDAETTTTYVNPNGSLTSELQAAPVREQVSGAWQPVDTTLQAVPGGYAPKVVKFPVTFSGGGALAPLADAANGSYRVQTGWLGALPAPAVVGNIATYVGVRPGVNIVMTAGLTGYDMSIVLTKRPTVAPSFTIPLTVTGLSLSQASDGGLRYLDGAGNLALVSGAPRMFGAAVEPGTDVPTVRAAVPSELTHTPSGLALTVSPSASFLADPSVSYPVTIDPPATLYATDYTYLSSGDPNDTNDFDNDYNLNGTTGYTEVGYVPGNGINRALYEFDTSRIAGAQISNAWLTANDFLGASCSPREIDVYSAGLFGSATSWNNPPNAGLYEDKETDAHAYPGCGTGWSYWGQYDTGMTSLVQGWANHAASNPQTQGEAALELRAANESDTAAYRVYSATTVMLVITYTSAVADPVVDNVQPCAAQCGDASGQSVGGSFDEPILTNSTQPELGAMSTVNAGGTITYTYDVQALDSYGNVTNDMHGGVASGSSGNQAWWQPGPTFGLDSGYPYRYAVTASYAGYSTGSSAWTYFEVETTSPPTPTISSPTYTSSIWSNATTGTFDFADADPNVDAWESQITTTSGTPVMSAFNGNPEISTNLSPGQYVLFVNAQDLAGNYSSAAIFYIWVGDGALTTPATGSRTQQSLTLSAAIPSGHPYVSYWWAWGAPGGTASFFPIPTADVVVAGSASNPSWPVFNTTDPQLSWNVAQTMTNAGVGADGTVQVEACFYTTSSEAGLLCATPNTVQVARSAFGLSDATQQIGPGRVSLLTGDFAVDAGDVSVPTYDGTLTLGRTATTLAPPAANSGATGIFGPGWTANLPGPAAGEADATLQDDTANGFVLVTHPDGGEDAFDWNPAGNDYVGVADAETTAATITKGANSFTLTDGDGTQTIFTLSFGTWSASSVVETDGDTTSFSRDGNGRVTQVVAPAPPGISCASSPTTTPGCRSVQIVYASTTTATGTTVGTFGDYAGRVQQVTYTAYDPNAADSACASEAANMCTVAVAHYRYDNVDMLRQAWDPRISPTLVTGYAYVGGARLQAITPPGQQTWKMIYDSTGRLSQVNRYDPAQSAYVGPTLVYGIPATCDGASGACALPTDSSGAAINLDAAAAATWNQVGDLPVTGTAIFPADYPEASTSPAGLTSADWPHASLTYLDANGRTVNTAAHASTGWVYDATTYDANGNVVRELTAANRAQAVTPVSGVTDPYVTTLTTSPTRSDALGTATTYCVVGTTPGCDDPTEVSSTLGPMHPVILANGTQTDGRAHTSYTYDAGAPTGGSYRLVTATVTGVQTADGVEHDDQETDTGYAAAPVGGDGSGWTLREPTTTTIVMPSGTPNIVTTTRYNTVGQVIESRLPMGAAPNYLGIDAHATDTIYYSPTASGSCGGAAGADSAGLPCQTFTAAQPTSGNPIPITHDTYNLYGQPLTETETATDVVSPSVTVTRTTTNTYDAAGRLTSTAVVGSQTPASPNVASRIGQPVPAINYGYSTTTGLPTTTSGTAVGNNPAQTITTGYDTLGRIVSYTDAGGATTTTSYDIDGRVATVTDPQETITHTYNGVAGEERGILTGVNTTLAGISPAPNLAISATYDQDAQMTSETLGDGVVARTTYNNAGQRTALGYKDSSGNNWLTFADTYNAQGQVTGSNNADGSTNTFRYDNAGRLTNSAVSGASCDFTVAYAYDADSNRTGQTNSGAGCQPYTATAPGTFSHLYNQADELQPSAANDPGVAYDDFGRLTTAPSRGKFVSTNTTSGFTYYVDDRVAEVTFGGETPQYQGLDPALRDSGVVVNDDDGTSTTVDHFDNTSDSPAWSLDNDDDFGPITTYNIDGPDGNLAASVLHYANTNSTYTTWNLPDLHGDTVAQTSPGWAGATSTSVYDPFGETIAGALTSPYGWLGTKQRATSGTDDYVFMGARIYATSLGRFLQTDPIPGGSCNPYDYACQDPINNYDLNGTSWWNPFSWSADDWINIGMIAADGIEEAATDGAATAVIEEEDEAILGAEAASEGASSAERDAVEWNTRAKNMGHIFDPKHNFGGLLTQFGSREGVIEAMLDSLKGHVPTSGTFEVIREIGGEKVTMTGYVTAKGVIKLGSAWIPK